MRILINQCRPALAGGLFAAILLSFSDSANADTVTISKTGMPVPGGDSVDRFGPGLSSTPLPLLNDLREVAFLAGLTGNSDSNRAILRGTGGLSPDGVNAYTLLG